jgi:hypothetical protein
VLDAQGMSPRGQKILAQMSEYETD